MSANVVQKEKCTEVDKSKGKAVEAAVEVVAFSGTKPATAEVSLATKVISRMNSAQKMLKGFTQQLSLKDMNFSRADKAVEKDCFVLENIRFSAVLKDNSNKIEEGVMFDTLSVQSVIPQGSELTRLTSSEKSSSSATNQIQVLEVQSIKLVPQTLAANSQTINMAQTIQESQTFSVPSRVERPAVLNVENNSNSEISVINPIPMVATSMVVPRPIKLMTVTVPNTENMNTDF